MEIKETAKQAFVYLEALLDARACFAAVKLSENDMNCLYYQTVRLGGTGGSGAGGAWGLKKGCAACWSGSLSGGSAGVCIFAFAWLRMMSASLRTVSGGSVGHGSAAGLSSKGWCRW